MFTKINTFLCIACICFVLFLAACASTNSPSFGPIQDEDFQNIFLQDIAEDQQKIIFYSRAIWYPNKNGFKFIPAGKKSRKGVLVYTEQGVYFSEWNAKKYNTVFNADYQQLEEVRLAKNDLFGRLVMKKDHYNSFEIMGVNGPDLPDKDETEVAYQIIAMQKN